MRFLEAATVIRRYLDEQDGRCSATYGDLLTTFGVDAVDERVRERMSVALMDAGIHVNRDLEGLAPTDQLVLELVHEAQPPWHPHYVGPPEAAALLQPAPPSFDEPPRRRIGRRRRRGERWAVR